MGCGRRVGLAAGPATARDVRNEAKFFTAETRVVRKNWDFRSIARACIAPDQRPARCESGVRSWDGTVTATWVSPFALLPLGCPSVDRLAACAGTCGIRQLRWWSVAGAAFLLGFA